MKLIIDIIFYIFGIGLPVLVILVAIAKKIKKKNINIINKVIIAVIIFLIFYMLKVGGIILVDNYNKKSDKINTTLKMNEDITSDIKTAQINSTSSSTTIKKKSTTKKTIEKKNITTSTNTIKSDEVNDAKYIDGILIVNKTYALPKDFVPKNTYKSANGLNYCSNCIDNEAYQQYKAMKADSTSLGLNIWIQSGYRSYELQESLYNKYVNRDGKEAADTYSARPGHSEHQSGLAFDLNTITDDFQYTDEGKWINENCYKYGFILRYPKGKENITGYKYESWHLRYVGIELASKLYNNGDWITLEEHFNITSKYKN